jgi:DNA topoisomerase I
MRSSRASGKRIDFPGFFRAYVEGSDDPDAAIEDRESALPELRKGDATDLRELNAVGHETQPPARYTEASLVKTLEAEGIGRPSTYASIIGTVIDRGYVERSGNQLVPTYTAFAVTELLEKNFPTLVDTGFTARMEEELDEIARGETAWLPYLEAFYRGNEGLEERVRRGEETIDPREASTIRLEGLDLPVRIGRWGPFVEQAEGDQVVTASLPADVSPGDLTAEQVSEAVRAKAEGPTTLGKDPESGKPVYLRDGPYGPYVQLGEQEDGKKPKRASLPKGTDPASITLDDALAHLSLPRTLGKHPETGKVVKAGVGRYGPFVVHEGDFRSLTKEDDVLTVNLVRALELLAQPKRGGRTAAKPLREVGAHPEDGDPITLHSGRYGPYVKHGKTNASLPKGVEPDDVTVAQAVELIAARQAKGGAKKGGGKKATARKKTTKRAGGKKGSTK